MRIFALFLVASVSLLAEETATTITQDGKFWVRTTTGAPPIPQQTKLIVNSRGSVILRGSADGHSSVRVTQRIRANSEEEAKRLFGYMGMTLTTLRDGVTRFSLTPSSSPNVSTEMQLTVPQRVPMVIVETQMGAVEAYDLDGFVDVSTGAGPIRVDRVKGAVASRTGGGEIHIGKIGGSLRSVSGGGNIYVDSTGGEANVDTAGGEIVVKQSGGRLVLSTEGGNISVERAGGPVEAHSGEGVIEVLQAAGIVTATTRGGSIEVSSARGVKAESAAGQVRVRGSSGPLRVSTAAGSILAELFAGMPLEDSSLVAAAGDITVLIPSNVALSVLAASQSGGSRRIVSDFSEVRAKSTGLFQAPMLAQGAINGGGPVLNLSAASGVIYLRRK